MPGRSGPRFNPLADLRFRNTFLFRNSGVDSIIFDELLNRAASPTKSHCGIRLPAKRPLGRVGPTKPTRPGGAIVQTIILPVVPDTTQRPLGRLSTGHPEP
jgi:hypothetical protein